MFIPNTILKGVFPFRTGWALLLAGWCAGPATGATPPDYAWAVKAGGGDGTDVETAGSAAAADSSGNVFVAGLLTGPSAFGTNVIGASGVSAAFLAKYNAAGEVQWARTIQTGSKLECNAVVVDDSGAVYVTGAANLPQHGARSMFACKYDPSGNLVWTNSAGAIWTSFYSGPPGEATGAALALDPQGNLFVAGTSIGQPAFGSSNVLWFGIIAHAGGGVLVTNRAGNSAARPNDVFLAKYDSAGIFQWVRTAGGTNDDFAYGVSVSGGSNVWLTGYFQQEATFDALRITSTNTYLGAEAFVAKYDSAGTALTAIASVGGGELKIGCGLAGEPSGGAYLAGRFTAGTMWLGGLAVTNTQQTAGFAPYTDTFLARLDAGGNVLWLKLIDRQTGGYGRDKSSVGLVLDSGGNPTLTGSYNDHPTFDTYTFASPPPTGVFVAKYDPSGLFQWALAADAMRVSGQEWTTGASDSLFVGNNLAADPFGNLYLTGAFRTTSGPAVFGAYSLASHTDQYSVPSIDCFVAKLGSGGAPPSGTRLGLVQLLGSGTIQLQVSGSTSPVVIEHSSNLSTWLPVATNTPAGGWVTFNDPWVGVSGAVLYRVYPAP